MSGCRAHHRAHGPAPDARAATSGAGAPAAGRGERGARLVMALAFVTMLGELGVGAWTGSMALLADGWHMASHVGALGLTCLAYWYGRRAEGAGRLAFGVRGR